ncbi:hypothetical protein GCM10011581_48310 [Saccharopolyspora subtropica]|uniref:Uncharacterized protein n=1 Tax=Saccharopolyspora thermophila TaxID=89367 RepID=A0A917NJI5_9PSEU|nr:hypothetical protein GCM10011581_48310 [Saccharopolyspora subtropica]
MRVNVLERRPVPGGTLVYLEPQGGEPHDRVFTNLDGPDTQIYATESTPEGNRHTRPFLDTQTRFAERGEPPGFELISNTKLCWCLRELIVSVSYSDEYGNHKEKIVIRSDGTPKGRPFETVAWGLSPKFHYDSVYAVSLENGDWIRER